MPIRRACESRSLNTVNFVYDCREYCTLHSPCVHVRANRYSEGVPQGWINFQAQIQSSIVKKSTNSVFTFFISFLARSTSVA